MRAVAFFEHGGPEVLTAVPDWPEAVPGPQQVVVQVEACSLNHLDVLVRRGLPGVPIELPRITGGDIAGTVVALGPGVSSVPLGSRVLVDPVITLPSGKPGAFGEHANGGLCERIAIPVENLIPLPEGVSSAHAAALPIAYGTAYRMLVTRGRVERGETVVVLGASGGVGTGCVQIAAARGCEVIAVASTQAKLDALAALGAKHLVLARGDEFGSQVWELTGKRGADVIVDYTGRATWPTTLRSVRNGGRVLVCGATTGYLAETDLRYVWTREIDIRGSDGWTRDDLLALVDLVAEERLTPVIDRVVGLDHVRAAEQDIEDRKVLGKIIIDPRLP